MNKRAILWRLVVTGLFWALYATSLSARDGAAQVEVQVDAAAIQILLDRANFSPGSIDNEWGGATSRTRRALTAFQQAKGLSATGRVTRQTIRALVAAGGSDELYTTYELLPEDVDGPFSESAAGDWKRMSEMESLGYTSLLERLGEKFHSSPGYLRTLNPAAAFQAGELIWVPNVEPFRIPTAEDARQVHSGSGPVTEVVVSEAEKSIVLKNGEEILFYAPITPGSETRPMPSGLVTVQAFDVNPIYYFSPEVIREAKVKEKLQLPPGPNNPVGVVWVDLSEDHYGLHGTPEPEKIGYTSSRGCVRLTNWDAVKVAKLLKRGTQIYFVRRPRPGETTPPAVSGGDPGERNSAAGASMAHSLPFSGSN